MAENNYDYRKLSAFRSFVKSTKVFVTNDHCLFASGSGYSEEYFRFFFNDIHSLKLNIGRFFAVWVTISSIFTVIFLALAVFNDSVFFYILTGGLLIFLLLYIWRGPKTYLTIRTATTTKNVYFGRKRKALKALRRLCDNINAVQGIVDKQELVNRLRASEKGFNI
jgi:hypothetical protein